TNVLNVAAGSNFGGLTATNVSPFSQATSTAALVVTGTTGGSAFLPFAAWNNATLALNGNAGSDTVTVNSATGAHADAGLTIASGVETATLAGAVTLTGTLAVTAGAINVNTTATIQAGAQSYTGPVTLGANATLGATGAVTFNNAVDGAFGLTVNA